MVQKKATKKKAQKKRAKKKVSHIAGKPAELEYSCGPRCQVSERSKHIGPPRRQVFLRATKTDVSIVFDLASPFQSGAGDPNGPPLQIDAGDVSQQFVHRNAKAGSYFYKFRCGACADDIGGEDNPEMVVP